MANSTMIDLTKQRAHPLDGKAYAAQEISISALPFAYRCALRVDTKGRAALSKVLGVDLPNAPKKSVTKGSRTALWIGPDEWLIIDAKADPNADLAKTKTLHSAVDVSHRNTALEVSGSRSADIINAGCPQDLSLAVFPVGACSRTVLGKIEIVLLRTKTNVFRVECWRSFSAYAFDLLSTAARDGG